MFDFIRLGIHYIDLAVFDTSYWFKWGFCLTSYWISLVLFYVIGSWW